MSRSNSDASPQNSQPNNPVDDDSVTIIEARNELTDAEQQVIECLEDAADTGGDA